MNEQYEAAKSLSVCHPTVTHKLYFRQGKHTLLATNYHKRFIG
jgi:hypothetical protein